MVTYRALRVQSLLSPLAVALSLRFLALVRRWQRSGL